MKPDLKSFPKLTKESDIRNWNFRMRAMCDGFNMGEVYDPNYIPPTVQDRLSYENKSRFFYAVLVNTVLIDRGRAILYRYRQNHDGCAVFRELINTLMGTIAVSHDGGKIFQDLANSVLGRDWKKSMAEYISYFMDTVTRYNEMVLTPAEQLHPMMVKSMLQRAVNGVRSLREVKDREDHRIIEGQGPLSLEAYVYLLTTAAEALDRERISRGRTSANFHEGGTASDDHSEAPIDADVPTYDINYLDGSRMPLARWKQLEPSTQTTWDTLPDKDKALILTAHQDRSSSSSSSGTPRRESSGGPSRPPTGRSSTPRRSANHTELTSGDDPDESSPSDTEDGPDTPEPSLQVNSTLQTLNQKKGSTHPGDLRRMLGRQTPRASVPPAKASAASLPPARSTALSPHKGGSPSSVTPMTSTSTKPAPTVKTQTHNVRWDVNTTGMHTKESSDEINSWGVRTGRNDAQHNPFEDDDLTQRFWASVETDDYESVFR